jgi:hypothetical protein
VAYKEWSAVCAVALAPSTADIKKILKRCFIPIRGLLSQLVAKKPMVLQKSTKDK